MNTDEEADVCWLMINRQENYGFEISVSFV